ncbi:MAG: ATP-binding protein [Clostridia bacterium]|nr:ATP-binding protein [Clostridia bacterium]
MKELTLAATVENIGVVTDFVGERLEKMNCPMKIQTQINIAIDEIFGNIAHYAYTPETGKATVRVEIDDDPLSVIVTFIDGGVPYNPLEEAEPDITLSAEERSLGGLGIFMVKKSMDEMTYRHENGKNILSIRKILRS